MIGGAWAPVDLGALAADLARRAVDLADPGPDPATGRCARLGVDGAVPSDTASLADAVAAAVADLGRPVARVRATDFLRPRSVRLEHGPDDPDAGYERWFDHAALRREVLDPTGPGGSLTWLPSLWDSRADRATRAAAVHAVPGTVVVLDGPFLLRWETADAFDLTVHLDVSPAALARRLGPDDVARVTGAWARYTEQTWPADRADVVLRFDRPAHPAVRL